MVPNGLNRQPLSSIAKLIADLGFNCVRLPFNLLMVLRNDTGVPQPAAALAANLDMVNLTPLEVFDATVAALTKAGLLVILNNHVSAPNWCCHSDDTESFWYTDAYPEESWLQGLGLMAARYRSDPRVVGMDLRNEVRPAGLLMPTWGSGDPQTDWAAAATAGGKRVLAANPELLIVVSGLHFGGSLCDVARRPLHESEPDLQGHVVYTAHEYPWFDVYLLASSAMESILALLAILWAILCSALALRRLCVRVCLRRCGYRGEGRLRKPCGRFGGRCPAGWWCRAVGFFEVCVATCIAASSLAVLLLGRQYARGCGPYNLVWASGCFLLSASLGFVAIALWLRLVVAAALLVEWRLSAPPEDAGDNSSTTPDDSRMEDRPVSSSGKAWAVRTKKAPGESDTEEAMPQASPTAAVPKAPDASGGRLRRHARTLASGLRAWDCLLGGVTAAFVLGATAVWRDFRSYETFARELDDRWGFLLRGRRPSGEESGGVSTAPVWLGEFGTDEDNLWWQYVLRYCEEQSVDWAYWSINGESFVGSDEPYGLLNTDSMTIRHGWKLEGLQRLMQASGAR